MRLRFYVAISIILISSLSLLIKLERKGNPSRDYTDESIGLVLAQPVESATTPALDTNSIGLIAYYQRAAGWTLADTVPAFLNYTDGGNYYDGFVRIWDTGIMSRASNIFFFFMLVQVMWDYGWMIH